MVESTYSVTGDVAITWTGPGGVEGSLTFTPAGRGSVGVDLRTGWLRTISGRGGEAEPTIVRVRRPGPDGAPVACVERLAESFGGVSFEGPGGRFGPGARSRPGGPLQINLGGGTFDRGALSAGRCAGPVAADIAAALPAVEVDLRRLRRGGRTLAFDARRTFPAGDFTVAVESTVRVRLGRARLRRERESPPPRRPGRRRPSRRIGLVTLRYAVERIEGALVTDFRGLRGFACAPLDACGLAGINRVSFGDTRGELELQTVTRRLRGRRPAVADVLSDLRRGRLRPSGVAMLQGVARIEASVTRDGAAACRDERLSPDPVLEFLPEPDGLQVALAPARPDDLSRTRCPGPTLSDLGRPSGSPGGLVDAAQLAEPEIRLVVRPRASFADGPYAATLGGEVAIVLRRVAIRTRTVMEDGW